MAPDIYYYGTAQTQPRFHIGDRRGGTFEEVEVLGQAVAEEAWKIAETTQTGEASRPPWIRSTRVQIRRADAPPLEDAQILERVGNNWRGAAEIAALGIGDVVLLGEPGEVFSETFVEFKRRLWRMGFSVPMMSGYANGFFSYLPPTEAFAEGGYEVNRARTVGLREDLQTAIWEAIEKVIPD
ncbi:MAG: hypothetical protein MUQ10_19715, partial [Anaerolineae bacterium]|nr:hypothetical protein [Anaerolineae bacterium]